MGDVEALIAQLQLQPHPEGGDDAEAWRAESEPGQRPSGSAIDYLLRAGERSAWDRVDAAEMWHYHAGCTVSPAFELDGFELAESGWRPGVQG